MDLLEIDEKRRENNNFPWLILRHALKDGEAENSTVSLSEYCEKVDKLHRMNLCPRYTELRESLGAYTLKNRYADKIKRIIEQDLNCSNPPPLGS